MQTEQVPQVRFSPVIALIFTALCAQLVGRYFAHSVLAAGNFYTLWIILRIVIPVIVLAVLRVPLSSLNLGFPRVDRKFGLVMLVLVAILLAAFLLMYLFAQGYFGSYAGHFSSYRDSRLDRFLNFMVFTSSTFPAYEFLHRCFLLMGLQYLLTERDKIDPAIAATIAIAVVWIFEVVFHLTKEHYLESVGMLIGSPILSYLAIRTRSVWTAFFSHLFVEFLFIASLIMR